MRCLVKPHNQKIHVIQMTDKIKETPTGVLIGPWAMIRCSNSFNASLQNILVIWMDAKTFPREEFHDRFVNDV